MVVGIVTEKRSEEYKVDIGASEVCLGLKEREEENRGLKRLGRVMTALEL
jgi:hypothetical protein